MEDYWALVIGQSLSCIWPFEIPWTVTCHDFLCFTVSWSLLKLKSIELVMSSNHLILRCPFLLLPSIFPSIRVFSNGSVLHFRWPKSWNFSFIINSSNEYSGFISFIIDWFDLLAVQATLKSPQATQIESINSSALSLLYVPILTLKQIKSCHFWQHQWI